MSCNWNTEFLLGNVYFYKVKITKHWIVKIIYMYKKKPLWPNLYRSQGWGRIPAAPPPGTLVWGWPGALPRSPPPLLSSLLLRWSSCLFLFPSLCRWSSPAPPASSPPAPCWSRWLGLLANQFPEIGERWWCRCLREAWGNRTLRTWERWWDVYRSQQHYQFLAILSNLSVFKKYLLTCLISFFFFIKHVSIYWKIPTLNLILALQKPVGDKSVALSTIFTINRMNSRTHPCLLNSSPMWSANRTVLSWPKVSVSGVGVLGLGCNAGQFSTTQPCLWLEGFRYSVAPPARTALKVAARSTLTLRPSHMTSPPATGRTPLPRRDRTLDITAGGTWINWRND